LFRKIIKESTALEVIFLNKKSLLKELFKELFYEIISIPQIMGPAR